MPDSESILNFFNSEDATSFRPEVKLGLSKELFELHKQNIRLLSENGISFPVKNFSSWVDEASTLPVRVQKVERGFLALLGFEEYALFRVWEMRAGYPVHDEYYGRKDVLAGEHINNLKERYTAYVVFTINSIADFQYKLGFRKEKVICPDVWLDSRIDVQTAVLRCVTELNNLDGVEK